MALPIHPVTMPTDMGGVTNGKLPNSILSGVHGGGKLHHLAARAWNALVADAWKYVGLPLTYTYGGTYRSYTSQKTLFVSRYKPVSSSVYFVTSSRHRKRWMAAPSEGYSSTYWVKKNNSLATAASPGTSNHGWGIAIDTAWDRDLSDGVGPDDASGITGHPGWDWLLANAWLYGFSWELQSEPWHIRYVTGDNLPPAVLAHEGGGTNPTDPPETQETEDMLILDLNRNTDWWVAMMLSGNRITHLVNGHHVAVMERGGVQRVNLNETELEGVLLSVEATNGSPFGANRPSHNDNLDSRWKTAQSRYN